MLHELDFLDADCAVGPFYLAREGFDWTANGLLRKMDELGVAEACPSSLVCLDYSLAEGNTRILGEVAESKRLHPVWCVGTHHTGEFPSPDDLIHLMVAKSVRMAKMLVGTEWTFFNRLELSLCEGLFDALAKHHIPLLLDLDLPDLPTGDLESMLRGWSQLPVILSFSKTTRHDRVLYYLWEKYRNLHVSLPGYQLLGGIEAVVERFGADSLVYGSRYPYFTPLQSMLQLIYSEISEDDKRMIAGGNMRRLLDEVRFGGEDE